MTDPFSPPPWRTIPPEVRNRIMRSTVEHPVRRVPALALAVAAAVVALAVGAVFILQTAGGQDDILAPPPKTTAGATTDPELANRLLDRCFPNGNVRPVLAMDYGNVQVLGGRDGGQPVFCEVTPTVTTIARAEPGRPGLVLHSTLGTVGGVADSSIRSLWIKTGEITRPATVTDGMYLTNGADRPGQPVEIGDGQSHPEWITLPGPATPPQVTVTHPSNPDRTSERGRELDSCIKAASGVQGVIDSASWEPGAHLVLPESRMIVARNDFGYSACTNVGGRVEFGGFTASTGYLARSDAAAGPGPRLLHAPGVVYGHVIILGVAPPSSRIEIVLPNGPTVPADVYGTTFAVALPEGIDIKPTDPRITFRLYDSTNKPTYSGPWSP